MSTDLYVVKVMKVGKDRVTLRLVIQDAQSGNLPESKGFALMLAAEAFHSGEVDNAIGKAISRKDATNEKLLGEKADTFIASMKLTKTRNFPIADEEAYNEEDLGSSDETGAWGEYTLHFVDPAWAKGWQVGKSWSSTSYAPPEPSTLTVPVSDEVDDGRTSFYFVEPTLPQAQIDALVKRCGGRIAKEMFLGLSYVVYPKGFNMKHPSIRLAQKLGGSSGLSIMSEPSFVQYIDENWPDTTAKAPVSETKSTKKAAAAGSAGGSERRRFELVEGASAKYWEVWVEGDAVHTHYGRIGTTGQSTLKKLGSAEEATKACTKLVNEKTKKGYVEK